MPKIPNELHWEQYGRPVTRDELQNALTVAGQNPDFKKTFWTDDPSTVLVPLKSYFLTMSQEELAKDKVALVTRAKLVAIDLAYARGPLSDDAITKEYGAHDVLSIEPGSEKEEKILREAYSAYGIDVAHSEKPYRMQWEKPISIPGVPAFGVDEKRLQQTRKHAEVFQTSEGVGDNRNLASKKDINTYSILYVVGGWHLDWDAETESQPGKRNTFPLDAESPSGFVQFVSLKSDGTVGINIDIVGSVARNPLLIGFLERMTQIYETKAQAESQETLEGWKKKENDVHFYGSLLWNEKRLPHHSTIEERSKTIRERGYDLAVADPRWYNTLHTTGPHMIGDVLIELEMEGKLTQQYLFRFPLSIHSAAGREDDAKWSLKPKNSFAATLEGGQDFLGHGGVIEYAAPIRNIVTVQMSEVSEYPNIAQKWFPKGEVARFWRDPGNSDKAFGFILSGQKVQGEISIQRHNSNAREENVFRFLAQQDSNFLDKMTAYKPRESNGDIYLTAYEDEQILGQPQRVDAVSSKAVYDTVAEHVWQEELKTLDLKGDGVLEKMVSERLENSRETGYALSSRYALPLSAQLDACRRLSYIEKPSAESMDHAVKSLQENQDRKIQRYPGLYANVVGNFLRNPNTTVCLQRNVCLYGVAAHKSAMLYPDGYSG